MEEKIIKRIEKLLALAGNNPNEKEAEAALLKAQKLMADYGIEQSQLTGEKITYATAISKAKGYGYFSTLASIIGKSFSCKVIIIDSKCSFFGRTEYTQAALTAFNFAYKIMKKNARRICRENGFSSTHQSGAAQVYNSYYSGFVAGIKAKLDEQCKALMIVVPKDVEDNFGKAFPNLRIMKRHGTTAGTNYDAYKSGFNDGRSAMGKRELNA